LGGKLDPVYFLYGEEPYFIDQLVHIFEHKIMDEGLRSFNMAVMFGKDSDFKQVVDEARQFPMMADRRIVILKEAQEMKTLPDLLGYIERPTPHTVLVIAHKYKKIDKRTKFGKAILDKSVSFESKPLYDNQLPDWIQAYVTQKSAKIEATATRMLAEYLGTDLHKVANEIDKLILSRGSKDVIINAQMVQDQIGISKEFNVFELQKALATKDVIKSQVITNYFIQNPKSNPLVVINSNLFNYFVKVMIVAQHGKTQDDNALLKMLALPSAFFLNEYKTAARNYSVGHLRNIIRYLKNVDLMSKGVSNRSLSDGALLKELIFLILHPTT